MSDHLDLDALADALAAESDLAGSGSPSHLVGCPTCTSRLSELRGAEDSVRASLSKLTDPSMPAGLVERITAALAAEAPLAGRGAIDHSAAQDTARATPGGATVTPLRPPRRWAPAVAAAVMVVAVGGLGYAVVSNNGGGDDASTTSADSAAAPAAPEAASLPPIPTSQSGTDYAQQARVEAVLPGVLAGDLKSGRTSSSNEVLPGESKLADRGFGTVVPQGGAASPDPRAAAPSSSTTFSSGGGDSDLQGATADPLSALREPVALEACLSAVLPPEEPGVRPLALDYATYQGKPALAVWLTDPDPAKVSVFVVGPQCSAADAALQFFTRVDRP